MVKKEKIEFLLSTLRESRRVKMSIYRAVCEHCNRLIKCAECDRSEYVNIDFHEDGFSIIRCKHCTNEPPLFISDSVFGHYSELECCPWCKKILRSRKTLRLKNSN